MKFRIWVEVDVKFDTESDGVDQGEGVINRDVAISTVTRCINAAFEPIINHDMVECLTDDTGFCVQGITSTVGNDDPDELPDLHPALSDMAEETAVELLEKLTIMDVLPPDSDQSTVLVVIQDAISNAVKSVVAPGVAPN